MAVCMFFGGTAFAVNPVPPKAEASKAVAKLLKQELVYPKFAKEQMFECCVLVRLIVEKDGSFTVDCINCTSETMKAHVTHAINQINKKELAKFAGQEFSFKINYKLI